MVKQREEIVSEDEQGPELKETSVGESEGVREMFQGLCAGRRIRGHPGRIMRVTCVRGCGL